MELSNSNPSLAAITAMPWRPTSPLIKTASPSRTEAGDTASLFTTRPMPVVLIGRPFWDPLVQWLREDMLERHGNISRPDLDLFTVTDDVDEAVQTIVQAFDHNHSLAGQPGTDQEMCWTPERRVSAEGTLYGVRPHTPGPRRQMAE